jgi:hypothetical protein
MSNSYPFFVKVLTPCNKTSSNVAESVARFLGLIKGTLAPNFIEIEAIFLSSVDTMTCSNNSCRNKTDCFHIISLEYSIIFSAYSFPNFLNTLILSAINNSNSSLDISTSYRVPP